MNRKTFMVIGILTAVALVMAGAKLSGRNNVYININMRPNFEPGEEIAGGVSGRGFLAAEMALYRVDMEEVVKTVSKERDPDDGFPEKLRGKELKSWTMEFDKPDRGDWVRAEYTVGNPGVGAYLLEARAEGHTERLFFIVTDIAAISKSDESKLVVFVVGRDDGKPKENAEVKVIAGGEVARSGATDSDGVARFTGVERSGHTPVVIMWQGSPSVLNFYNYGGRGDEEKIYVYTDRPVYRPGHTVQIKGIARTADGYDYSLPACDSFNVIITDPRGNELAKKDAEISEFGTFSLSYELSEEPPLGHYGIRITTPNRTHYSHFQVEEYRKPEFEVTVAPDRDIAVRGDEISFRIDTKYYFGEPVKNAEIKYTISKQSYYDWYGGGVKYPWYHESGARRMGRIAPPYYNRGETVAEGSLKSDENGSASLTFDDTGVDNHSTFTLTATVTDKSRREVSGSGSVKVMAGEFRVFVSTSRYLVKPGEKIWITAKTLDIHGAPVSEALTMKISSVHWDDRERKTKEIMRRTIETSAGGETKTHFVPDEAGYYEVEVFGADSRDNPVSATTHFRAADRNRYYHYYSRGEVEMIADRDTYKPGETVQLLITSPLGDASALVTVEAEQLLHSEVKHLKNGMAIFEFEADARHQPNVYVTFTAIHDGSIVQQRTNIIVPPEDKFIDVTVESDREIYEPGDEARVKITAVDADGEPVRAEVSLGVVDESLYALYPETTQDIRAVFYGPRWSRVTTTNSLHFYMSGGALDEAEVLAEAPSAGGVREKSTMKMAARAAPMQADAAAMQQPAIRSDFPDTAYWRAHVVTGGDGTAEVTFDMPDSLTTWRLTSRAVTLNTRVGQTTAGVVTKKNLIVRLETPRFFTQNDRQNVTAVVHNYLDTSKRVKTILNVKGLRLEESNEKTISVPAGGDARVEWPAVVEAPQDAWVTVKALTDEESDAMQLTIPVLPHGSPGRDAAAGEAGKSETITLTLPEDYVPGTEELSLTVAASLTAGMFDVLEYLAGYPYGCVEQTMSRFLPDVVIAEAYQRAGRPLEGKLEELPQMVEKGMQRLSDFQKPGGGWGWWRDDEVNPYMTAYVVMGLAQARRADYAAPNRMLERGVEALKSTLDMKYDKDNRPSPDRLAYVLFALSEAGESSPAHALKLYNKRKKLSNYGRAALAMAMHRGGQRKQARALAAELIDAADVSKTSARWNGRKNSYGWTDNEVEISSLALMALIEVVPDCELIPKAVRYLNVSRRGDRWYSTKDTAMAVMALTRYMAEYEDPDPDYSYTVSLNGKEIMDGRMAGVDATGDGVHEKFGDVLAPGANKLTISKTGRGNLYYYAYANYFEGAGFLEAQEAGIRVERYYSEDAEGEKRLEEPIELKPGDRVWSQVRIRPESAFDYVVVEDFLPSGFEVVKEEMPNWIHPVMRGWWHGYLNREVRDEKVVTFFTRTYREEMAVAVPLRAEVPGEISAMPCRAELMYFPEVGGRSAETRFIVTE